MTPRTDTAAPTDRRMWRRLLALVHPDAGGDHETFIWVWELREHVAGDTVEPPPGLPRYAPASRCPEGPERVPFDPDLGYVDEFVNLTHRALSIGKREVEPHRSVLIHLMDCDATGQGVGRSANAGGELQAARGHRL